MTVWVRAIGLALAAYAVGFSVVVLVRYFSKRTSEGRIKWHIVLLANSWVAFALVLAGQLLVLMRALAPLSWVAPSVLYGSLSGIAGLHLMFRRLRDPLPEEIAASVPWLLVDLDTQKILGCNVQVERLFGYERGELHRRSLLELIPPALRSRHWTNVQEYALAPRQRLMGFGIQNLVGMRKDGSEIQVVVSLDPEKIRRRTVLATVLEVSKA